MKLSITDIEESYLIGDIKFPIYIGDDSNSMQFIRLRRKYRNITKVCWIKKRAVYAKYFEEVYNPKVRILIWNN